jgi:nitrogen fixation protein NifB
MSLDLTQHPCFNDAARRQFARIHLPVAPDCNVQCNFCRRVYDCANESRPGVTSAVLSPGQAVAYLQSVLQREPRISVVGIAGPGDPMARPEPTLQTLREVRRLYPGMLLCVASNGLNMAPYAEEMANLAVSHVTITVNAVDPAVGEKIYAWVRHQKRMYRGRAGAEILLERQLAAVRALKQRGITVKINTIVIPGINDHHVLDVARQMAELGADIANCVALYPVADTPFESITPPTASEVASLRAKVAEHLPIMEHCTRCRADAVGLLGEKMRPELELCLLSAAAPPPVSPATHPYVAVGTLEGVLVNQHLGEAEEFSIFRQTETGFERVETRPVPPPGGGSTRWESLAQTLCDCRSLLVSSAGDSPRSVLGSHGIEVILMEGLIEDGLNAVFRGEPIRAPLRRNHRCGSGAGCGGNGLGCS